MADRNICSINFPDGVAKGLVQPGLITAGGQCACEGDAKAVLRGVPGVVCGRQLMLALFLLSIPFLGQSTNFQYVYDTSGRLLKVVDSSGNVLTYAYDSVGNILSVTRSTLPGNALAILNFTPSQGAVGQSVTIQGQAFNTTASSDIIKFNGTLATVTAATANGLPVTVPSVATTGPITVSVGSSTAPSATNFTFLHIPAITSTTPPSPL